MVYALLQLNVTDADALAAYREKAAEALARHGGKVEAAAPQPTILEGERAAPDIAGVLSFPDRESALAWIDDPDLQELHALRRKGAESNIVLVG
ncbi:DUF1330 domain-containing protein [Salinisphaera sp. P385]|uniref:DUF1330 domain-containing protein n=1 Tax=Spectribacter acetivorans TaxID=3075603 RepID=A0ABU3BB81_9GAMM|nr:DUF1330 domain-containing protein [Salinisphaera sp. P385]MDT0619720.1 DUF1330 domain-containing protein [Salinisphaera sp. P385]